MSNGIKDTIGIWLRIIKNVKTITKGKTNNLYSCLNDVCRLASDACRIGVLKHIWNIFVLNGCDYSHKTTPTE